jgi:serine/threonine-protein kinase
VSVSERTVLVASPGTTEGGRSFLQERLSLFGRWFFAVAAAYYLIANFPTDLFMGYPFDWVDEWFGAHERLNLGIIACAAVVWLTTRGRPRPAWMLAALDAFALIVPLLLLAIIAWFIAREVDEVFTVLLASATIIVVRAILVPSSARRTLVLGTVAYLPVFLAIVHFMYATTNLQPRSALNLALSAGLWGCVAIASATLTSRILFRLRTEVADARKLGQYTLQQEIGHGAMGIVYRASHALLRRPTAIKLMAPANNGEADLRRFEREVQLTAELTHPNTVSVYDFGRSADGVFYYVMEYIDGISLEELIRRYGPQPPSRVIHILRQACGALEEAHRVGLIHRDIKPANLMLCMRGGIPDIVKVLDFGLVKPLAGDGDVSASDVVVGTPLYLSPEAIENPAAMDGRSDLYALGAVGYFILTGTPVFSAATVVALCSKHLTATPEPPSKRLGKPVPADLEAVLTSCLAKDPADRPARAEELEQRLAACRTDDSWTTAMASKWWRDHPAEPPQPEAPADAKALTLDARRRAQR